MPTSAKVIADSITDTGARLTTLEVTFHRFVLAEFNTHRMFSRNSASSRAIPVEKQIRKIQEDIAFPEEFGANQPGMQAGTPLAGKDLRYAEWIWEQAGDCAIEFAEKLLAVGVHKQVTNRLLEPFMWHTTIVSSTEWENFFSQRCSPLAQPEIRVAALLMEQAIKDSTPVYIPESEWHTPYIQPGEHDLLKMTKVKVSAARCARVSYLTQDGVRDIEKDLELYNRLVTADPPHWSPLEHVATPIRRNDFPGRHQDDPHFGNFKGWHQLRHVFAE